MGLTAHVDFSGMTFLIEIIRFWLTGFLEIAPFEAFSSGSWFFANALGGFKSFKSPGFLCNKCVTDDSYPESDELSLNSFLSAGSESLEVFKFFKWTGQSLKYSLCNMTWLFWLLQILPQQTFSLWTNTQIVSLLYRTWCYMTSMKNYLICQHL